MSTFSHTTVLLRESIEGLSIKPGGVYTDGTLGGGGHSEAICAQLDNTGTLIGIDRDQDALDAAAERLSKYPCRKILVRRNYAEIRELLEELEIPALDGAILDLGVSSFQLDTPERGFSYMQQAPLDMRMSRDDALTAYDVVNDYKEAELTEIIRKYGEERWAARIAAFICRERRKAPIQDTFQLVDVIKQAIPAAARREGPHPAKRTFQALRIEVNDELGHLERATEAFCDALAEGGRLCIITFHSLEDRIVKETFARRENPCTCPKDFPQCVCGKQPDILRITRKPITPDPGELADNPRSRSAKLRIVEKRKAPK